jgi:urea transport system permease protein
MPMRTVVVSRKPWTRRALSAHSVQSGLVAGPWRPEVGGWRLSIGLLLLAGLAVLSAPWALAQGSGLAAALQPLAERSFKVKEEAIKTIAQSGDERAVDVLRALLKGDLYYRKDDKRIVLAKTKSEGYRIMDGATGADLGEVGCRAVVKIITNNQMRSGLRAAIAGLSLNSPQTKVRLGAVKEMLEGMDAQTAERFRQRLAVERDGAVRDALTTGIAIADLKSTDPPTRRQAAEALRGSLEPATRNWLMAIAGVDESPDVRAAAKKSLEAIDLKLRLNQTAETLFFGLSLGSVLVLAAVGLAITFGVMGVINMAHGELIMLGAYTTYLVQQAMPEAIGLSLFVAIPAAFLVSGAFGMAIERLVIRFLYGRYGRPVRALGVSQPGQDPRRDAQHLASDPALRGRGACELRRLQGPGGPLVLCRPGRAALRHRPQRGGQDDHDGRDHREDPS